MNCVSDMTFLIDKKGGENGILQIYITTSYTENMKMYPFTEASQRLLGIPPKRCKCGDERGGLPHLHPNYIPFEFED